MNRKELVMDEKIQKYLQSKIETNQIFTVSSLSFAEVGEIVNVYGIAQFMYQKNRKIGFLTCIDDKYFEKKTDAYMDVKITNGNSLFGADGKHYYMVETIGEIKIIT